MVPGQLLDDRYRLEAEAGTGGMGTVWRALDTRIDRTVAIKVLHSHLSKDDLLRERFDREARIIGALQHPAVVRLYDFTETTVDGIPVAYLVMEYVPGVSLLNLLTDSGQLTPERTLTLLASAADGLHAAHQRGIVHRDVKPGNILVAEDDTAKIVDFGISQSFGDRKLTVTGHFMGSLHYVSPEQLQGHKLTPVSDVYSLGVVGYEALTGELPFPGDTPASVLTGHLQREPEPLPDTVPAPVAALLMRALAKEPDDRFASAADFAAACRTVRDDTDPTAATPIPATIRSGPVVSPTTLYPYRETVGEPRPRRRNRMLLVALLALALAATGGGLTWFLLSGGTAALGDGDEGPAALGEMEQLGDPVPFADSHADDRGAIPEPVTDGANAYFAATTDDGMEAVAVALDSGDLRWRAPLPQPDGGALRAGKGLLYTADTQEGVIHFIDTKTGQVARRVDLGGRTGVTTFGDRLLLSREGSSEVTAYDALGRQLWTENFDETVIDVDVEATWRDFTNQPGRFSAQKPEHLFVYGQDGTVWRLDATTGDTIDADELDIDATMVTSAFQGLILSAEPEDDGYTVTAYDVSEDFDEVGSWEVPRAGFQPRELKWCGEERVCVKDRHFDGTEGAAVLDFTEDDDSEALWHSDTDKSIADIYAAGNTTAVVQGSGENVTTQFYDEDFEALGRAKNGVFRPIDADTFLDYPRTAGSTDSNPLGQYFFTGLDADDGSTRNIGDFEVFPQCVTEGVHLACPTQEGFTVWGYRDGV